MQQLNLTNRLKAIYKHIPPGGLADIGTDHGHIPVSLVLSSYVGRIVASDIKRKPLERAMQTALKYDVYDRIEFILCDGLTNVSSHNLKTIILAGMGGETISSILAETPWTMEEDRLIILQPMSKSDVLRDWLQKNSYRVLTEELCEDNQIYEIITATGGNDSPYSPAERLLGHIPLISPDPLFKKRVDALREKTTKIAAKLKKSNKPADKERLGNLLQILRELTEL